MKHITGHKHKIIVIVSVLLLSFVSGGLGVFAQATIKNSIKSIEQRVGIKDTTIYTNVYHQEIMNLLSRGCQEAPIQKGDRFVQAAGMILENKYATKSDAQILEDTTKLYELVAGLDQKKLDAYDGDAYCKLKFALNGLLLWLRERHIAVLEKTAIINDFDGIVYDTINGYTVKLEQLQTYQKNYNKSVLALGTKVQATVKNPHFLDGLDAQQLQLAQQTRQLMETMIAHSLVSLRNQGVFTQKDVEIVADKIILEYVKECAIFNGKYDIRQTIDSSGTIIDTETTGVHFKVNYCPNYFVIRDFPEIFQKIITHEMGHHYYYYHDTTVDTFEAMCWSGNNTRNSACSDSDFITDYARSAAVEDYAEHFMHRFLKEPYGSSAIIQKKYNYFAQK